MILKIVLGSGGRGLLDYISQLSKSLHHPQINPKIYANLPKSDPFEPQARRGQPAPSIHKLQNLSSLHVVHHTRSTSVRKSFRELLLQQDALADLEPGTASDAPGLRRSGGRAGSTATKQGGRRIEKPSAPPTFSNFGGTTPRQIAAEFGQLRKLKPNLKKAVGHLILSPGPDDRVLSKKEWKLAMEIALAEHGATDAPHAAWLHSDTARPHLHVFFSRITAACEVVSDSQSYQKNRTASKKITQELKLNPLPTSPNPRAPGDREAAENSARRAAREGDEPIAAAEVRDALCKATDLADFEHRLAAIGAEAEFQRRGASNEIYGWKLRRTGQIQWQKASTLAKDLSWPKISHRFDFAESDTAKQIPTQIPVPGNASRTPARLQNPAPEKHTRVVQPVRTVRTVRTVAALAGPANDLNPAAKTLDGQLEKTSNRLSEMQDVHPSPLFKTTIALTKIMVDAARFSLRLLAALINFLRNLLRCFGIGLRDLRETQYTFTTPAAAPQLAVPAAPQPQAQLETFLLPAEAEAGAGSTGSNAPSAAELDDAAAGALQHAMECLAEGRLQDLPEIEGAKELKEAVEAENKRSVAVGSGFLTVLSNTAIESLAEALAEPLADFLGAAERYQSAFKICVLPIRNAQKNLADAEAALEQKEKEHAAFVLSKPSFLRLLVPKLDVSLEKKTAEIARQKLVEAEALAKSTGGIPAKVKNEWEETLSVLLEKSGEVHAKMVEESAELGESYKSGAAREAAGFKASLANFTMNPIPSFATVMKEFAGDFDSELSAARAAERADNWLLFEKEMDFIFQAEGEKENQEKEQNNDHLSDIDRPRS